MRIIWQGMESPSDVDLAYGVGVRDMAISFSAFKRRVKRPHQALDRFPDDVRLYLYDSSAWDMELSPEEHIRASEDYEAFISRSHGRLFAFVEYNCPLLGDDWVMDRRESFYEQDVFGDKSWVMWSPSSGVGNLRYLAESYQDVVVPLSSMTEAPIPSTLSILSSGNQTRLHCFGLSLNRDHQFPFFQSHFSSTHLSALRHGEVYVPDRGWLTRVSDKADIKGRYAGAIRSLGCDPGLVHDGNHAELEVYTLRAFRWLETQDSSGLLRLLSESEGGQATSEQGKASQDKPDSGDHDSGKDATRLGQDSHRTSSALETRSANMPRNPVPSMSVEMSTALRQESDGRTVISEIPLVRSSKESARECGTCSLSSACPAYLAGSRCKFSFPVELRTRDQVKALTEAVLEMQAARVFFARFEEEVSGFSNDAVGKEMDRLARLATSFSKLGEAQDVIKIEARSSSGGILSQLFGRSGDQSPGG